MMIILPNVAYSAEMSAAEVAALILASGTPTPLRTRQRHPFQAPAIIGTHELQVELEAAGLGRQRAIDVGREMARQFDRRAKANHHATHGPDAIRRADLIPTTAPAATADEPPVAQPHTPTAAPTVTVRATIPGSADVFIDGVFIGEVERRHITIEEAHESDGRPFGSHWRSWATLERWQLRRGRAVSEDQGWFGEFHTRRDAVAALVSE